MLNSIVLIYSLMCSIISLSIWNPVNANEPTITWNYGKDDRGNGYMIDRYTGNINGYEKVKRIPLNVHPCIEVVFLQVRVANSHSIPQIAYDEGTQYVVIAYEQVQRSTSTYDVVSKSRLQSDCSATTKSNNRLSLDYYGY